MNRENIINLATVFIAKWEQYRSTPYQCTSTDPMTIGYGETDKDIVAKGYLSEAAALCLLKQRIANKLDFVLVHVKTELTDSQYAALISLIYNIGETNFLASTMCKYLQDVTQLHLVPPQFGHWIYQNHKLLLGLVRRRYEEELLWLQ